jgi:hypothetical protein
MTGLYTSVRDFLAHWRVAIIGGLFSFASGVGAILAGAPLEPRIILPILYGPVVVAIGVWSWYDEITTAKAATEVGGDA